MRPRKSEAAICGQASLSVTGMAGHGCLSLIEVDGEDLATSGARTARGTAAWWQDTDGSKQGALGSACTPKLA